MFDEIFLFVKLAETKSIKETAQSLDISNSTVTRSIQKLEAELNIKLFKAHAHHFDLTTDGQKIYDHFVIHKRNFINEINSFMQNKDKIRDTLRLALPHSVAELILPSLISWFKDRFPESRLIISYMATSINLLKDGLDLAISRREPASTDHKVSILSRIATKLYATPAYCQQFGLPQDIDELMNHNWVVQTIDNRVVNNFAAHNLNTGEQTVINYQPQFLLSNGSQSLSMALSNQVIVLAPDYFAKHEIERGNLIEVLPKWEFGKSHLYLIRNPHLINQLEQEVVDFILSLFADDCKDLDND
ncbi:LysR family transcriptional regulator [Aquella oligotrophica]|uniref:HTH lysR-type domain-containing protein n=1 Tax=Aquella oligotrophica TaxID=2067065 RepID=A0A2I7N5B2_9NEIS|nr:LysR family transcriptional regulator [Aquella oligotrophica]AUR51405.1 hypothetical protein CUN60_03530 [Aquella oligotrophica]